MNFIEKIQNRPRFIRVQILWISVILVMSIIISFWLVHLNSYLQPSEPKQEKDIPSLFITIREDFSFLKENLQAQIRGIFGNSEKQSKFEVEIIK